MFNPKAQPGRNDGKALFADGAFIKTEIVEGKRMAQLVECAHEDPARAVYLGAQWWKFVEADFVAYVREHGQEEF